MADDAFGDFFMGDADDELLDARRSSFRRRS